MSVVVQGLAVLLLLALIVLFGGHTIFRRQASKTAESLLAQARGDGRVIVTEEMLQSLPAPVQRYLKLIGVVGKPIPQTVRLKQVGMPLP